MTKLLKWQEEELTAIKNYSNEELYDVLLSSAGGDDYDGCFSVRGQWIYDHLEEEMFYRLTESGFIDPAKYLDMINEANKPMEDIPY